VLGAFAAPALMDLAPATSPQDKRDIAEAKAILADPTIRLLAVLGLIPGGLLLVSGIGYLRQKKTSGRIVGSIYALPAIVLAVVGIVAVKPPPGVGGNLLLVHAISFLYPVLTLFLVNGTFKDDLVN